jgi:hypothetical protein
VNKFYPYKQISKYKIKFVPSGNFQRGLKTIFVKLRARRIGFPLIKFIYWRLWTLFLHLSYFDQIILLLILSLFLIIVITFLLMVIICFMFTILFICGIDFTIFTWTIFLLNLEMLPLSRRKILDFFYLPYLSFLFV